MSWNGMFDSFPSYVWVLLALFVGLQVVLVSRNPELLKSLCIIVLSPFVFCFCVVQMIWQGFVRMCLSVACEFIDD